jgi:hypothetical protein
MSTFRRLVALAALALVFGLAQNARAQGPMGRSFGIGLALGNPTSFTGKYHLGAEEAIDFHVGVFHAYGHDLWDDSLFLGGDYLFEIWNFLENGSVSVPFYAGPGLGLVFDTDDEGYCYEGRRRFWCDDYEFGFGPRLPIGIGVEFQNAPFEIMLEMAPSMMILIHDNDFGDDVDIEFDIPNFAFIARFYFG